MKKGLFILFILMCQMLLLEAMPSKSAFILFSPMFVDGRPIPIKYSAVPGGKDISPPLRWSGAPDSTISFALTCEDVCIPLLGSITHWIIYNIPPDVHELKEAIPVMDALPDGSGQGRNFSRHSGYMGPNPLWGTHRYVFRLYALDRMLQFGKAPDKRDILKAIHGHILGTAETTGTFSRVGNSTIPVKN